MQVRLTKEQKKRIEGAADVYKIMQQVLLRQKKLRRGQEYFWVLGLHRDGTLLFAELVALGAANRVAVKPPEVFRLAIYKQAHSVIMVHNHPGTGRGKIIISEADINATDHWLKAGRLIDISVEDHLVITETRYLSFAAEGIMDIIENRRSFEILPVERAEMDRLRLEAARGRAEKEKAISIAKSMKAKGYKSEEIRELTGLTLAEIKKI